MNPMNKLIEDFAASNPLAWQAMCDYHRWQATWAVVGWLCVLVASVTLAGLCLRRAMKAADPQSGWWAVVILVGCGSVLISIAVSAQGSRAFGRMMSPERDAARDVIQMMKDE